MSALQVGQNQVLFAGEVPVEGRSSDVGLRHDPIYTDAVDALAIEELRCRREEPGARFGVLGGWECGDARHAPNVSGKNDRS